MTRLRETELSLVIQDKTTSFSSESRIFRRDFTGIASYIIFKSKDYLTINKRNFKYQLEL